MKPSGEAMTTSGNNDRVRPLPAPGRMQELLFDAARLGRTDMILALMQAGVDLGATDAKGHTALILASYNGHADATAALLRLGADVDQPDEARGNTALMGVAFKGHDAIAAQLLQAGAAPDVVNRAGQTALMMAALFDRSAIVDCLIAAGADPEKSDDSGNSAISVALAQRNEAMAMRLSDARPEHSRHHG